MYINNFELLEEIAKFNGNQIISEKLHILLYNLAKNISYKGNWSGYTWREDMVSDAYLKCLYSIGKFDPERSDNPFSFFTIIIFHFYIDYIKKYKKNKLIIEKLENMFKNEMTQEHGVSYENFKHY